MKNEEKELTQQELIKNSIQAYNAIGFFLTTRTKPLKKQKDVHQDCIKFINNVLTELNNQLDQSEYKPKPQEEK